MHTRRADKDICAYLESLLLIRINILLWKCWKGATLSSAPSSATNATQGQFSSLWWLCMVDCA